MAFVAPLAPARDLRRVAVVWFVPDMRIENQIPYEPHAQGHAAEGHAIETPRD
ncbi:MAG TPA: hypothetical protein VF494_01285 [Candidatus Limnocylindrales bacterium]